MINNKPEKSFLIKNLQVFTGESIIKQGYVVVEDGRIQQVGTMDEYDHQLWQDYDTYDMTMKHKLIPGMIDMHIHGADGADTMDATPEAIATIAKALPKEGTTSFLATTITKEKEEISLALENVANYMNTADQAGKAEVLGIHLEGPFISSEQAGAQPPHAIIEPNIHLFAEWQKAAQGNIKQVTLAPEREDGLALTRYLKETNVIASIGHSDANYQQVRDAINYGLSQATHLFNGMKGLHHREPGVVGAVLLHNEIKAELIVDGIHVHPQTVKLTYQQKGKEGVILVTDAMRAKCLGEGIYQLGGQDVYVDERKATLKDGTLAGSILKLKDAIINMMNYSECNLEDIVFMTAINPAKQLGIFERKGSISRGKDADLVILNENHEIVMTFCKGVLAYQQ